MDPVSGPHQGQPVALGGAPLERARAVMILVHGRGATADSILTLEEELGRDDVAYLAPQARGSTWYPHSFLAPISENEPGLSSGLELIAEVLREVEEAGVPAERVVLLGFSQGACLSSEFVARQPRRYGGLVVLSGGLIGVGERAGASPPDDKRFDYEGDLQGCPVFIGCSDVDAHIPVVRVRQTADVMRRLGGDVTERIYPGMGHTINTDELAFIRDLLGRVAEKA